MWYEHVDKIAEGRLLQQILNWVPTEREKRCSAKRFAQEESKRKCLRETYISVIGMTQEAGKWEPGVVEHYGTR